MSNNGQFKTGKDNPNFGKPLSQEIRDKISKSQKGISVISRGHGNKGRIKTLEEIQKCKDSLQKRGKKFLSDRAKKSHTPESDAKRRESIAQHNAKVLEIAEKYRKEGYEVITERDLRPDLIIKKGNIIKAVEVQRGGKKQHNYDKQNVFDQVIWEAF